MKIFILSKPWFLPTKINSIFPNNNPNSEKSVITENKLLSEKILSNFDGLDKTALLN